jgi:predicted HicB family RNase H-like nuclease
MSKQPVIVRVDEEFRQRAKIEAAKEGISMQEWIERAIQEAAKIEQPPPPPKQPKK